MAMRLVLQGVERASLLVDNVDKWVEIQRGLIVHVCFLKDASEEVALKGAADVLQAKIFPSVDGECNRGRAARALDENWDILIVPQATLAGKIKGKQAQYHSQYDKEKGAAMYEFFCNTVRDMVAKHDRSDAPAPSVQCGTYGNRQGLKLESLGPFTHVLEY
eukprot:TRINITY_DN15571_c0_g1_i1.p1 TRINITY_DN15571_c0_g1~~TRINITY_DN15571_c0_g1_i1.p1  ORF type:complete len:162 (+),score=56.75 TRINITY_DN15571_c0_g1_i1:127-612(+)